MELPPVAARQAMRPSVRLASSAAAPKVRAGAAAPVATGTGAPSSASSSSGLSFRDVLSALNPLQYLPVVGSIYRALTGDVVPETLRTFGSLAIGGIMGGPIGLAVSAATTLFQKVAGIDPDRIVHQALAAVGIVSDKPQPALAAAEQPVQPIAADGSPVTIAKARRIAYRTIATDPLIPRRTAGLEATIPVSGDDIARRQAAAAAYARNLLAYADVSRRRNAAHLSA